MSYISEMRLRGRVVALKNCRGFSILYALALLIVIALIASYLLGIVASGQKASTNEILSARALYAAESGIQIVSAGLFPVSGAAASCSATPLTINFSSSGLQGCQSAITCGSVTSGGETIYDLTATGTCGPGGIDQGQRTIQVKLGDIN